jgi:hypothetical protein
MVAVLRFIVATEILLLPLWVGTVWARPSAAGGPQDRSRALGRLSRCCAAVVVAAMALPALAALAEEPLVGGVLRAQAVAVAFLVLLAGLAAVLERGLGPVAAQVLTALLGWALLAGILLAGPVADLLRGPAQETFVRVVVHVNPLVVAERELGLDWLHQSLTYRLTPLGESYGYLVQDLAWWKTVLGHLFVGSGLLVFGTTGLRRAPGET